MSNEWQAKLVQYETIAEVQHEKREKHEKEVMWKNLINFAFDDSAGNVAHWTTHLTPNQAPMARRVPRRNS